MTRKPSPPASVVMVDDDDLTVHGDNVTAAVAPLLDLLRDGVTVVIRGRHFFGLKGMSGAVQGVAMISFVGEIMTGESGSAALAMAMADR